MTCRILLQLDGSAIARGSGWAVCSRTVVLTIQREWRVRAGLRSDLTASIPASGLNGPRQREGCAFPLWCSNFVCSYEGYEHVALSSTSSLLSSTVSDAHLLLSWRHAARGSPSRD